MDSGVIPSATGPVECDHGRVSETSLSATPRARWQRPRRSDDDRIVAGVAAGVAAELGVEPLVIRLALVVLTVAGGWGLALYALAWALSARGDAPGHRTAVPKASSEANRFLAIAMIVLALLLIARSIDVGFMDSVVWPLTLFAAGVAVANRRGVDLAMSGDRLAGADDRSGVVVRVAAGVLLVFAGVVLAVTLSFDLETVRDTILVVGVVLAGLLVVLGPWVGALANDLTEERRARIRADERAEVAAHLHDSVLQTLSLIQRRSDDVDVTALARRQERELRSWLYGRRSEDSGSSLRALLEQELADVEERHRINVEVVVVGDGPVDDTRRALLAATREAVTNAAVHSGADHVDVYAEIGEDAVEVFVRDTGVGFDPDAVSPDRRGLADSVHQRLDRVGGSAVVTSELGIGTEVELSVKGDGGG